MVLTVKLKEEFKDALKSAFYTYDLLKQMLYFKVGKNIDEFASSRALDTCIPELIMKADAENWLNELLRGAREQTKRNVALEEFEKSLSVITKTLRRDDINIFEAKIKKHQQFFDVDKWLNKLMNIEKQVCKIEVNQSLVGTGFLIAPDIVMTNYHVIKDVLSEKNPDVVLRFDYKIENNGDINNGTIYKLANEWLINYSPYSNADFQEDGSVPKDDELDYALLRVNTKLVDRNYIEFPKITSGFDKYYLVDMPLFIVQHPDGEPLKLSFDSIIGLNDNKTRLHYKTYTEGGSSGSPCFNGNWELIALHHCGWEYKHNGGIPIVALTKHFNSKGIIIN